MIKTLEINLTEREILLSVCDLTDLSRASLIPYDLDEYINCGLLESTVVLGDTPDEAFDHFKIEAQYLGHHIGALTN